MTTATKEALHRLIEQLPDEQAERLLHTLEDQVAQALALAPVDDEPLTADQLASVERARQAYRRGAWTPGEEVRREIGW